MNWRGWIKLALSLLVVAVCLFEFLLQRQFFIFRDCEAAFLSVHWMLVICLVILCGTFLYLAFNLRHLPLIGLLLIAVAAYYIGGAKPPATYLLTLMFGVTLGTAERFFLAGEIVGAFLIGLIVLLTFAAWWHLDMSDNFYHGPRWMGLWDNPNNYGMLMAAGTILTIGLLVANANFKIKNPILVWFLGIAAGVMMVGLGCSYSRGSWCGAAAGLLYLAWIYRKLKWGQVLSLIVILAILVCVFWNRTPDSAPWYVKRADLGRPSAQHRATAWRAGLEIMWDHPVGVGWNNAVGIYNNGYSPSKDGAAALTTNDYLMIGTELGMIALVCFVSYVGLCLFGKCNIENDAGRIHAVCRAGAIVFLVTFWFDGGLFKLPTAALFWILLELGSHSTSSQTSSTTACTSAT